MNNVTERDVLVEQIRNALEWADQLASVRKPPRDGALRLADQLTRLQRRIQGLDPDIDAPSEIRRLRLYVETLESQEEEGIARLEEAHVEIASLQGVITLLGQQLNKEKE